jgi:hypothetical protein
MLSSPQTEERQRSSWVLVWDNMNCRYRWGLADRAPAFTPAQLRAVSARAMAEWDCQFALEPEIRSLTTSRYWSELVLPRLETASAVPAAGTPRFFLDLAHDSNTVAVLHCLQPGSANCTPSRPWPPYATWVVTELWRDRRNGSHHVRVITDNAVVRLPGQVRSSRYARVRACVHAHVCRCPR